MSETESKKIIDIGEGVWAEIIEDRYNPLIKRRELKLKINHVTKPTPMRITLRLTLAKALGVDVSRVYVRSIRTEYGIGRSIAEVHVYDSKDKVLEFEPKHIIERNGGIELEVG